MHLEVPLQPACCCMLLVLPSFWLHSSEHPSFPLEFLGITSALCSVALSTRLDFSERSDGRSQFCAKDKGCSLQVFLCPSLSFPSYCRAVCLGVCRLIQNLLVWVWCDNRMGLTELRLSIGTGFTLLQHI